MSVYDKGFVTVLGCSVLLVLIAIPLALRMVPRNIVYGFRTRTTLRDDAIWFEANAHFGRRLLVASLCGALAAYLIYRFQLFSPETSLPISVFILVAPSLLAALSTAGYIRSITRGS
jgi:uncharacterized membrane protein